MKRRAISLPMILPGLAEATKSLLADDEPDNAFDNITTTILAAAPSIELNTRPRNFKWFDAECKRFKQNCINGLISKKE